MCTSDNNRVLSADEEFFDGFHHRGIADARIENMFDLNVSPRECIADNHEFRIGLRNVLGVVALEHENTETIKEIKHQRINVRVRSADLMSLFAKHPGKRRHRRTANTDEIDHLNNRGLQKLEDGRRRGEVQTRAHTERDDNIRSRSVSSGEAVENREPELAKQIEEHFLQGIALLRMLGTIEHFAEYDAVHTVEFSCMF